MANYGSTEGVQAIVPALGLFSAGSSPTYEQVVSWLAAGYATINRAIAAAGYSTPVASTVACYDEIVALNELYAAAYALRARGIDSISGETEQRSEAWLKDFRIGLKDLAAGDLLSSGLTLIASTTPAYRRRVRTLQLRKIDGYSAAAEPAETAEPTYASE